MKFTSQFKLHLYTIFLPVKNGFSHFSCAFIGANNKNRLQNKDDYILNKSAIFVKCFLSKNNFFSNKID